MLSMADPTARTNAIITRAVDAIDRVDLKTAHLLGRKPGITVHSIAGTQHYTFPMRTQTPPFDDNNVRLALKHAIDREEMVEKILFGYGVVGNDHPIGRGQRFFAEGLEQRVYDPDKAKHYLKQAGLDSLSVDLSVAGALFAESTKAANVNLNLIREPNDGYWKDVWNKKPFVACYWAERATADWMFSTAYEAGVPWKRHPAGARAVQHAAQGGPGGAGRVQAPRDVRADAADRARRGRPRDPDVRLVRLRHVRQAGSARADRLGLGQGR